MIAGGGDLGVRVPSFEHLRHPSEHRPAISPEMSSEIMHEITACVDEPTAVLNPHGHLGQAVLRSFFMMVSIASTELSCLHQLLRLDPLKRRRA